ncbi:uncharacterized protein N7459_002122 [Penicillium hispanicum]|uniref:uncharacterized protein n=1 Tax=Penicillium hispanicum TaxID=1080232 RepID=UPI0025418DE2|nr:uncharacterized protein N7459_002122 [Penicillium hispanicum]KAJ5591753.1 hypothetical protein N7459_002122 [Penicillium hispanicum]
MLHRSALEDETRPFHPRRPSEPPSGPPPNRPASRTSRPSSRNRMVRSSGAITPTGLGVVTENTLNTPMGGPRSTSPIKEGLGSLNRWSQSTSSSRTPSDHASHRRGSSKMSLPSHSPQRGPMLGELPELSLPELRASELFSTDSASHLDLSFTASSQIFQSSLVNEPGVASHSQAHNHARTSEGAGSLDEEGDVDGQKQGQTQKAMLSRALQKANTAVLLDNAANFEGAMEAYTDACQLLQLVMLRSNGGDEEKLKLQEIRDTYTIRITELQRMDFPLPDNDRKALPERPPSQGSYDEVAHSTADYGPQLSSQHSSAYSSLGLQASFEDAKSLPSEAIPPRRQSLRPTNFDDQAHSMPILPRISGRSTPTGPGNNAAYNGQFLGPSIHETNETTSWLDTIDESGASSPSSANSKASSVYLRRRTSRRLSTDTEAEFDAALDAAVEAAYDEGLEPVVEYKEEESDDIVANARRNIELAKQRVREAEREAEVAMNRGREILRVPEDNLSGKPVGRDSDYLDEEAEEEERLLEEMTKGYVMDEFEFGVQSKSALPRESDSSNMSGRTWESSAASNITGPGATLSTLTENVDISPSDQRLDRNLFPSSPPSAALPPVPTSSGFPSLPQRASLSKPPPPTMGPPPVPSVRARRLSGQNTRELKIETSTRSRADSDASGMEHFATPLTSRPPPPLPKDEPLDNFKTSSSGFRADLHPSKRNTSVGSVTDHVSLAKARTHEDDEPVLPPLPPSARPMGKVPSAPDGLDKPSSKSFRTRNVSVPNTDTAPGSPTTPWSGSFPTLNTQKAAMAGSVPVMPTPTVAYFTQNGLPTGGLNLFDCNIHSPVALGRPNSLVANAPLPLEPCPESFLLRPFWLMRCLFQTIAHPHGGYLSAKLFIPRDVWRVKNVKLKAVEDKVSNCDLLTAALLKLAQVDTYDADAVLEEMQSLESVLDQVQAVLSKKLGSEVGVHTAMPLFRPSAVPDDPSHPEPPPSRTSGTSNKSYLPTWKRLRAKTSGIGTTASSIPSTRESNKDHLTLNSLPMTSVPTTHTKRNVTQLEFSGPNSHYMGALARLFDAAQVIDQIAQQVEDPGLKHSSPTHVGLELSTRHAAEFFGFYVCRFALADVGMMLDKFIKRGSEWVLV